MGLSILNGNIEGDEEGEITYVGGMGCLVIDYGIRNEEGRRKIKRMKVKDRIESDHGVLDIEIDAETKAEVVKEETSRSLWTEKAIIEYRNCLEKGGEAKSWRELEVKIRNAVQTKRRVRKKNEKN
ncbi:hypothetical protein TSAR_010311 [Trichomalopsis sarcophagae]|uniref:Uncharacterized protein n=1 Tax=Trichomalopsis sarcophagae TaxID=543379 RepID=A0A232EHK1_9HYME|nr:hypothetical protein TSAR_010311 [Trichomalopsis sarcophagae]